MISASICHVITVNIEGKNFAERIKLAGDLMVTEIRELTDLSKRLTESRIKELTEIWRDRHAED